MLADGRTLRFTLKGGALRAQTDGRTATGQVKLDLARTGQLQADAQVRDPSGPPVWTVKSLPPSPI